MKLKKQILTRKILAMAICTGTAVTVQAVENGVTNWPNGVNTVLPAM